MKWISALNELFEGKVTYIFLLVFIVMIIIDAAGRLPLELVPYRLEMYFGLLGAAGLGLRRGLDTANKKLEQRLIEKLKPENGQETKDKP